MEENWKWTSYSGCAEVEISNTPLTALVDDEDWERVINRGKWYLHIQKNGHKVILNSTHLYQLKIQDSIGKFKSKVQTISLHTFILGRVGLGQIDSNLVHHINGDIFDDRKDNLIVTNYRTNNIRSKRASKLGPNIGISKNENNYRYKMSINLGTDLKLAQQKAAEIESLLLINGYIDAIDI